MYKKGKVKITKMNKGWSFIKIKHWD